ncbi:hypothetical protein C2S51_030616 [Perilla frutescens var. frutescens]|nr:hypothetical protein C2S51_030616 [Perilla frutescens var. frutescens]
MSSSDFAKVGLIKNSNGSFTRIPEFIPSTAASSDLSNPVLTKDVPINPHNNTWARIYIPRRESSAAAAKLPLIVFYHGGGFVVASAATTLFQNFCCNIVQELPAVMVSVDYRLAPEHRLPVAYDDGMEALHWIKTTDDEWLTEHADFSKCFLMGNSAGGNLAFHVAFRADQLLPVKIQGVVLHQPFFGGAERTPSEIRLANNLVIPLHMTDLAWDLALPVGSDRDHEYSNPMKRGVEVDKVKTQGWKVLVTGYEGDPLIDRQIEVVKMLRDKGVVVVQDFREGASHGIEFYDHSFAHTFSHVLKDFLLTF